MGAIIRIYDERKKLDSRLKGGKGGNQTPMYYLWDSPDAFIVNVVEYLEALKGDGYTEKESIQKLLSSLRLAPAGSCDDIITYLKLRLEDIDPQYLSLGDKILFQAVAIARKAALFEIAKREKATLQNPSGNLVKKYNYSEIQAGDFFNRTKSKNFYYSSLPPSDYDSSRDWNRLFLRMTEEDEVWFYLTPYHGFEIESVALVRQGQVIEYVRAAMPLITFKTAN